MVRVHVTDDRLVVEPSTVEKVAGLLRGLEVPLSAVREVEVLDRPLPAVHGLRAPGFAVPGRVRIGSWRGRGRRGYVVVRRGQPALRVALEGESYDELLVGCPGLLGVVAALREALPGVPVTGPAAREVAVEIRSGDLRLVGTLTLPSAPGPHPGALILTGSGELDRDGDHPRLPLGVSRELAHDLAARGVASLRYDKRGVGASQGSWLEAGISDNVADARAALEVLASRPEVAGPLVLLGHSEGGYLVTAVAAQPDLAGVGDRLAGLVLLATSATSGEEMLRWQTRQVAGALPAPVRLVVRLLRVDVVAKQQASMDRIRASTTDVIRMGGRRINARWHRELLAADPAPLLARVGVPVLAVTGSKDLQVDPADLRRIAELVPGDVETHEVADLTHLLRREDGAPSLSTYKRQAARPTDPEVVELVGQWVARRTAAVSAPPAPGTQRAARVTG